MFNSGFSWSFFSAPFSILFEVVKPPMDKLEFTLECFVQQCALSSLGYLLYIHMIMLYFCFWDYNQILNWLLFNILLIYFFSVVERYTPSPVKKSSPARVTPELESNGVIISEKEDDRILDYLNNSNDIDSLKVCVYLILFYFLYYSQIEVGVIIPSWKTYLMFLSWGSLV